MKIAWNAIVKNESARIERCLRSILPYIDFGIVVDTGSTDNTLEIIQRVFDEANKPVEMLIVPFQNFEQARNAALDAARYASTFDWDYLFLVDADMELKVEDPNWLSQLGEGSYDIRQVAGAISYFNRRLLYHMDKGRYIGVTHEYLDIPSVGRLEGVYFLDHADGANRVDKFTRDIVLLEEALKTESREGIRQRYTFYLAQSYMDAGQWAKAAEFYAKRVTMGGYDEEIFVSQCHYAHCLDNMGQHADFVSAMLKAYTLRPQRAEPLYDLAKHFRLRGENHTSLIFSEAGMQIYKPHHDLLFVNDYVYETGLREEFSICAYYDDNKRHRGAEVCNALAIDSRGTPWSREQARSNLFWYLRPLVEFVPSFHAVRLNVKTDPGYVALNPSFINYQDKPVGVVRTVNYTITPEGHYVIRGTGDDNTVSYSAYNPIDTRNLLVRLNPCTFSVVDQVSIKSALPDPPKFPLVRGFEDSRLYEYPPGQLNTISTVRELNEDGWCEQYVCRFDFCPDGSYRYSSLKAIHPTERHHEKNWAPFCRNNRIDFMYRPGRLIDCDGVLSDPVDSRFALENVSGGSQIIKVGEAIYLGIAHEARPIPGKGTRYYSHRFIRYNADGYVTGVSPPFFFFSRQIEFAAGLAYFPQRNWQQLLVSFGVRDCEAWVAVMDVDEVLHFIGGK